MKSIHSNPHDHGAEGDERIRTAVTAPGADMVYERSSGTAPNSQAPEFGGCEGTVGASSPPRSTRPAQDTPADSQEDTKPCPTPRCKAKANDPWLKHSNGCMRYMDGKDDHP